MHCKINERKGFANDRFEKRTAVGKVFPSDSEKTNVEKETIYRQVA